MCTFSFFVHPSDFRDLFCREIDRHGQQTRKSDVICNVLAFASLLRPVCHDGLGCRPRLHTYDENPCCIGRMVATCVSKTTENNVPLMTVCSVCCAGVSHKSSFFNGLWSDLRKTTHDMLNRRAATAHHAVCFLFGGPPSSSA